MSFLLRPLLAVLAAVVLAGAIVFDASVRVAFSTNPPSGAIVAGSSYGPDGREVAFWTDWRERPEIWAVSTVDGALQPIVDGLADPRGLPRAHGSPSNHLKPATGTSGWFGPMARG